MKACYIPQEFNFFRSSWRWPWAKETPRSFEQIRRSFLLSGYERVLTTWALAQKLLGSRLWKESEICLVVSGQELRAHESKLAQLQSQGVYIILVGDSVSSLSHISGALSPQERVLNCKKPLKKSELEIWKSLESMRLLLDPSLESVKIQEILERFQKADLRAQPSQYLERTSAKDVAFWYDPEIQVVSSEGYDGQLSIFSIIIPFQDNPEELHWTLRFLSDSLHSEESYEVIVVDDSAGKSHRAALMNQLIAMECRYKYVSLNRSDARQRGDERFRAGVARNAGAAQASGIELVFLDSDVLVGADFWSELMAKRAQSENPFMPKRFYLREEAPLSSFADLELGRHTQLSWGGHWEEFYRHAESEEHPWKWTSTFCLAVPRVVFQNIGGFRRNFFCYGFEDTDLGLRLHQNGQGVRLMDAHVFHLPVQQQRSEYAGKSATKRELLKKSFQVFQRNAMDPSLLALFSHVIH